VTYALFGFILNGEKHHVCGVNNAGGHCTQILHLQEDENEKKWTPYIIAAGALVVFIVLGACATVVDLNGPRKVDKNLGVYNPDNLPNDQLCTLEIVGGIHVRQFNGVTVGDKPLMGETALAGWGVGGYNANKKGSTVVALIKIPAGSKTGHA